jgi:hypothetical protein
MFFSPGRSVLNCRVLEHIARVVRVTITIIKMLLAIPLTVMGIGAIWLIWTLITL